MVREPDSQLSELKFEQRGKEISLIKTKFTNVKYKKEEKRRKVWFA